MINEEPEVQPREQSVDTEPTPTEPESEAPSTFSRASLGKPSEPVTPPPLFTPSAPPKRGFPWGWFAGGGILGCGCLPLLMLLLGSLLMKSSGMDNSVKVTKDSIGLVNISGVITSGGSDAAGLFASSNAGSHTIIDQLEEARENDKIKAVVLWINSPGGSAAGSDEVFKEVLRLKEKKKVIVSMGDVAASGGYYIASAGDRIYANGATLTGSIGVISQMPNLAGLYKKIGYNEVTIKAGRYKDIGSTSRPMTAEERTLLQQMVNDIYEQFLASVAKGRNMPMAQVRQIAEGRIYTGRQAKVKGLVDEIGGLKDAVRYAGKVTELGDDPNVVNLGKKSFWDMLNDPTAKFRGLNDARWIGLFLLDPRAELISRSMAPQTEPFK